MKFTNRLYQLNGGMISGTGIMFLTANQERDVAFVWQRIAGGDRVRFYHDFYGGQWVELRPRWAFWQRCRVQLSAAEIHLLKSTMRASRQRDFSRLANEW